MSSLRNVQPTKLQLINLKRNVVVSRRIHKILEDKKEVLIRELNENVEKAKSIRHKLSEDLLGTYAHLLRAYVDMGSTKLDSIAGSSKARLDVDVKVKKVMDVRIPVLIMGSAGSAARYGVVDTSPELDEAVRRLSSSLADILKAAEVENTIFRIAAELKRTQRLINALEYIIIPRYEENIKFISMVLEEREREEFIRLKKLKYVIEERRSGRSE
ncbi:MAG: V-type ATP synthase subunit D [Conexivisphaera sp.]|jgi:V/A-type H+-transporting ATPase subunit D